MSATVILIGPLAAAALSAAVLLLGVRPWRRSASAGTSDRVACIAVAAGYACGHIIVFGVPTVVPRESQDWLVHAAGVGLILGLAAGWRRLPAVARHVLTLFAGIGLAAALLSWKVRNADWTPAEAAAWYAGLGTAAAGTWALLGMHARRTGPGRALSLWLALAVGAAALVQAGGFAKLAILAGVLVAVLAVVLVVALWARDLALQPATVGVVTLLWSGLLINGFFLGEIPVPAALLAAAAPWAGLVSILPAMIRRPITAAALAVFAAAALAGTGVWITFAAAPAPYY